MKRSSLDLVNTLLDFHEWSVRKDSSSEEIQELAAAAHKENGLDIQAMIDLLTDVRDALKFDDISLEHGEIAIAEVMNRADYATWSVQVGSESERRFVGEAGMALAFYDALIRGGGGGGSPVRLMTPENNSCAVAVFPNRSPEAAGLAEPHELHFEDEDEERVEIDWEFLARDLAANLRNIQEETIDWVRDLEGERPSLDERYGRASKALHNYDRAIAGAASRAASEFKE